METNSQFFITGNIAACNCMFLHLYVQLRDPLAIVSVQSAVESYEITCRNSRDPLASFPGSEHCILPLLPPPPPINIQDYHSLSWDVLWCPVFMECPIFDGVHLRWL